ncbi:MAG: carboxypeptidase regulatory-like domain-containing protein, partial [Bryobacteraceae bacterium]
MRFTFCRRAFVCCFLSVWLFCALSLFGQSTTSLRGTVTDAQNAAIADAVVLLHDAATGFERNTITGAAGEYQFAQVPPGTYSVTVKKPGFASSLNRSVKLEVNTPATLDCHMELGSVATTVDVQESVTAINTVDGSVGNPFQEKQVKDLPLQTRNVVELLSIQPGVTQTGEVLGARRDQNNITLDGVDVNNNQNSGIKGAQTNGSASLNTAADNANTPGFNAAIPVPLDSVEEFRVTVAGQGADLGRSSGGQVTLITKSGTNTVHGTLYEYNRNTLLAANDFFNNQAGVPRAALVRNQFGVSLGGPIIKNRVFLFGNWERRIDASAQPQTATVPSQALRDGNLTVKLSNGSTQVLGPADVAAMDPLHLGYSAAMKQYLNAFPLGNDPALSSDNGLNFNGLRFNTPMDLDQSAYVAKLDVNLDQARKHTLSVRGTLNSGKTDVIGAQFPGQAAAQLLLDNSKGISANYTWVPRPSMVNSLIFGLTRLGLNNSGTIGTALGFSGLSSVQNYNYRPSIQIMPTYNIADNFTWTKSQHTISTGANIRFIRNTHINFENSYPDYRYNHNTLAGLGGDAATIMTSYLNAKLGTTGLKLADATAAENGFANLLGLINDYSATYQFTKTGSIIPFGTPATREYAVNDYEFYIQDSWRVRRDLTITAGLRYSNPTVPWEVNGTEVVTTTPLQQYFAERVGAMQAGL